MNHIGQFALSVNVEEAGTAYTRLQTFKTLAKVPPGGELQISADRSIRIRTTESGRSAAGSKVKRSSSRVSGTKSSLATILSHPTQDSASTGIAHKDVETLELAGDLLNCLLNEGERR